MGDLVKPNESPPNINIGNTNVVAAPVANAPVANAPVANAPVANALPTEQAKPLSETEKATKFVNENIETAENEFDITINYKNELIPLKVKPSFTLLFIKNYIQKEKRIPVDQQQLSLLRKVLSNNSDTLADLGVYKNSELVLETPSRPDKDNLEIVKLNVVMHTNKNKKESLTANLFVLDKPVKGEYPFLCTNVEYNRQYLEDKTFFEIVQIFFNEKEFENFALSSSKIIVDSNNINANIQANVMFMLEKLFPITFPIKDDVQTISKPDMFNFEKMFQKIVRQNDYVYLNIDRPSTVTQVIWLDTVRSNPVYVKLNDMMRKYKKDLTAFVLEKYARKATSVTPTDYYKKLNDELRVLVSRLISNYKPDTTLTKLYNTLGEFTESDKKEKLTENIEKSRNVLKQKIVEDKILQEIDRIESRSNIDESTDRQKIQTLFENFKQGTKTDDDIRNDLKNYKKHGSIWWKLYFIFAGLKKNTAAYNTFVDEYVKRFVLQTKDESRYWYSSSSNESRFYKNLSDLEFHFDFMKKVEEFVKQRRKSISLSNIFEETEENYTVHIDKFLSLPNNTPATVDKVREPKKKDEDGKESNEYKTKFYEIQLGVALVGGKVPNAPSDFWCAFNSAKLANDYKFLSKYDIGEIQLYPYVEIQETVNEVQPKRGVAQPPKKAPAEARAAAAVPVLKESPKEFSTILNLKKGGVRKTRNKRSFAKRTRKRSFYRNFQKKQSNNN